MTDESIDFSPLDPTRDSARFDAAVSVIAHDAMLARARRVAERSGVFGDIASWFRPALIAAGVVLAVALPALARHRGLEATQPASATEVLGIPTQFAELLHSPRTPSLVELHAALLTAEGR